MQGDDGSGPYREIPSTDLCQVCDVPTTGTCARCGVHTCDAHLPDGDRCESCLVEVTQRPNRFRIGDVLTFLAFVAPAVVVVMLMEAPAAFLLEHWLALSGTVAASAGTLWAQDKLGQDRRRALDAPKHRPRLPPPANKAE